MKIYDTEGNEVFGSVPGGKYDLKPIYPLVDQLERPWPVTVNEAEIPRLYTVGMYNTVSALGSLFTATFGLGVAYALSQMISLFFIPSRSMDPTLAVGDVVVVEKVSPRIFKSNNHVGDVILFHPPSRLQEIVKSSGGRIGNRDLFVKRVAAEPTQKVTVGSDGKVLIDEMELQEKRDMCSEEPLGLIERYIEPGTTEVQSDEVFVMGDCSSVSIDSRVWGPLPNKEIIGKPLFRVWPIERFGSIPTLEKTQLQTEWSD
uniref:Mitochondrial inner membrane protease subunit n=1 Tax=Cyclophora tenuis TaxID=216820 RepID=A0A7S1CZJ0_CYCTE